MQIVVILKQSFVEILQFVPPCLDQLRNPLIKKFINLLHNRNLIVSTDTLMHLTWNTMLLIIQLNFTKEGLYIIYIHGTSYNIICKTDV